MEKKVRGKNEYDLMAIHGIIIIRQIQFAILFWFINETKKIKPNITDYIDYCRK